MSATSSTSNDWYTSTVQQRSQKEKADVNSGKVSHDDFLKLLTKQLTTQDPLNPMQDIDFTAQLAQLQALEEQIAMTKSMSAMRKDSQLQAGSNMIGKYISGVDSAGNQAAGLVARVVQSDGDIYLELANKQKVAVTDVTNLWADSTSMADQLANSGGVIGMWVEAGYDSETKQPIRGIVEKIIVQNGQVGLKLYGGQIINWNQIQELRAPTEDEIWYTLPDEVRAQVEAAKAMMYKTVTGKTDSGETVTGIVQSAELNGSSVYLTLYNGKKIKFANVEGTAKEPTAEDVKRDLTGFWAKGLDSGSNAAEGIIVDAQEFEDGMAVILSNGKRIYFDSLTEIRAATDAEKKAAEEAASGTEGDGGEEGGSGEVEP